MANASDDYDTPWKDAVTRYFPEFMAFFFPRAHAAIDWSRPYVFLDQELAQLTRDGELGKRLVDKLVQVHTCADAQQWVLVHIEVQGRRESKFSERVFTYHYRVFDRFRRPVASLAVLADRVAGWRPQSFVYSLLGCELRFTFAVAKLTDYAPFLDALLTQANPFAQVVAAHLLTQHTRGDAARRHAAKRRLARVLYGRDWSKQSIIDLYSLIDWMMRLPAVLELDLWREIRMLERGASMPYVTSIEKIGRKIGRREGLKVGRQAGRQEGRQEGRSEMLALLIESRFGVVPQQLRQRLNTASSAELDAWARKLFGATCLDDVFSGH
jgi:hypothetical protein